MLILKRKNTFHYTPIEYPFNIDSKITNEVIAFILDEAINKIMIQYDCNQKVEIIKLPTTHGIYLFNTYKGYMYVYFDNIY